MVQLFTKNLKLLLISYALFATKLLFAGTITSADLQNCEAQVLNVGTLVCAVHFGTTTGGGVHGPNFDVCINGLCHTVASSAQCGCGADQIPNLTINSTFDGRFRYDQPPGVYTGDFLELLSGIAGKTANCTPLTLQISCLTIGNRYLFQGYWEAVSNCQTSSITFEGTDTLNCITPCGSFATLISYCYVATDTSLDIQFSKTAGSDNIWLSGYSLQEVTKFYWDTNSCTAGSSNAGGTWDAATTNWTVDSTGSIATCAWSPNAQAYFSAGTNATGTFNVTVCGTQNASGLYFEEGTVTLQCDTINLTGCSPIIDVAACRTANIDSELSGSNGFTKTGTGTLHLNNGCNQYSGTTTVCAGTVTIVEAGEITLGSSCGGENFIGTGAIVINGGTTTIQTTGNEIEADGSITVNCGTLNLTSCINDVDFDASTSVLDVNGGNVNVSAGDQILILNGGSWCVSSGTVTGTATNQFRINSCSGANLTQTGGTINISTCCNVEIDGIVNVSGCGTTTTFNATTRTRWDDGSLTVSNGGRVITQGGDAIFIDSASLSGGTCATKGTLEVQCANLTIGNGTTVTNCVNITMNTAGTHCLQLDGNGTLCNVGTLSKTGTGTVNINTNITTLDANNVVISNGTIALQDNEQIVDTADLNLAGGTLQMSANNAETVNDLTITSSSAIVFDTQSDLTVENFDLTAGQTLTITGWTTFTHYTTGQGAGTSLRVDQVPGTYNINNISVNGTTGVFDFMDGGDGYYYLVLTTPEPSTYLSVAMLSLILACHRLVRKK